jgi:hypothetical protein
MVMPAIEQLDAFRKMQAKLELFGELVAVLESLDPDYHVSNRDQWRGKGCGCRQCNAVRAVLTKAKAIEGGG